MKVISLNVKCVSADTLCLLLVDCEFCPYKNAKYCCDELEKLVNISSKIKIMFEE